MSDCVIVLSDFFSAAPGADAALPRLDALETVLARANGEPLAQDWRSWLAERYGAGPRQSFAATVARAAGVPAAAWLATPVHLFAGLDSVQLHPLGLLSLEPAEQALLARDFNALYADVGWQLHTPGGRELLLSGPAFEADASDPALLLGADPSPGMPRGPGAPQLRRLGTELEMWLHQHPLNQARRQRGALAVSALWLWGAAAPMQPISASAPRAATLLGHDSFLEAVWRLRALPQAALPQGFSAQWLERGDAVVLYPMLAPAGLSAAFSQFEQQWLSGTLAALRAGRMRQLSLLLGDSVYHLRRWHLLRGWRRRRPWWERVK